MAALAAPLIALGAPAAATAVPLSSAPVAAAAGPTAASVAAAVRATASRADAAAGHMPAPPRGWTTEFADSFNGPARSKPSAARWHYDVGPGSSFGTGEIETMTDSTRNGYLNGRGHLDLTALDQGGAWTSARIQTNTANVGAPRGGELEVTASIRQPSPAGGLGYWPAFWMLGPGQWPENGEIDILEDVNALSEVSGTIHCGTYPGGRCHEPDGIGSGLRPCPGCQGGYHTYTMILDRTTAARQSITFYLDGHRYFRARESKVGASAWRAAFDHKLSIIFDLAMGGGYPDGVCGCTTPTSSTSSGGTMSVAYVAAYQRAG
jgi:beta-glucanase (GH16 family)